MLYLLAFMLNCSPADVQPLLAAVASQSAVMTQQSDTPAQIADDATIDPIHFFSLMVTRFQELTTYEDIASVRQVTERPGESQHEVNVTISCKVSKGELSVETIETGPDGKQAKGTEFKTSPAAKTIKRKHDLWMAPHMSLKFTDEPLQDLRAGVDEGFTPTSAERVNVNNEELVRLELRSGDGRSDDVEAEFDFYVNPESMLIERIEGRQRLDDGADYHTTLDIEPVQADPAYEGSSPNEEKSITNEEPVESPAAQVASPSTSTPVVYNAPPTRAKSAHGAVPAHVPGMTPVSPSAS